LVGHRRRGRGNRRLVLLGVAFIGRSHDAEEGRCSLLAAIGIGVMFTAYRLYKGAC
jgi:hypothetical protein